MYYFLWINIGSLNHNKLSLRHTVVSKDICWSLSSNMYQYVFAHAMLVSIFRETRFHIHVASFETRLSELNE